ncbi:hypothetical protein RQP46_002057 [Phenoliferia psychrophenolica]
MASALFLETSLFLKRFDSPHSPPPDELSLRRLVERVGFKLSEMEREVGSTTREGEGIHRCASRLRRFLKTDLRKHETLVTLFYAGERDEWILRLEEALEILGRYLEPDLATLNSTNSSFDHESINRSYTTESSGGELWLTTERRARSLISDHYDYPRRIDPFQLRTMLLDVLLVLEDIYAAGDPVPTTALKDLRRFCEYDDRDLVRTWPKEQKHPSWIIYLREATYVIRITLDLRTNPPPPPLPFTIPIPTLSDHEPLPPMRFNFPRHWRTTPLRIYPGALPPLPSISKRRHEQIFGSRHSSSSSTAIVLINATDSYRPLDFLGDALLGHLVSRILHKSFPQLRNGHLTYLRSLLVRNTTLSYLAYHYSFHTLLRPTRSLSQIDQKEMADLFEAYLGALSLESRGERKAEAWIATVFCPAVFPEAGAVARSVAKDKENEDLWDDKPVVLRQAIEKSATRSSRTHVQSRPTFTNDDTDRRGHFLLPLDEQLAALRI